MATTAAEHQAGVIDEFRADEQRVGGILEASRTSPSTHRQTDRVVPVIVLTPLGGA